MNAGQPHADPPELADLGKGTVSRSCVQPPGKGTSSTLLVLNTAHAMMGMMDRGMWQLGSPSIYTDCLFEVSLETFQRPYFWTLFLRAKQSCSSKNRIYRCPLHQDSCSKGKRCIRNCGGQLTASYRILVLMLGNKHTLRER